MHMWAMTFAAHHRVLLINIPYGVPTPVATSAPASFLAGPNDLMKLQADMVCLLASLISRNIDILSNSPQWERHGRAYEEEMTQNNTGIGDSEYMPNTLVFTMLCHGIFLIMS